MYVQVITIFCKFNGRTRSSTHFQNKDSKERRKKISIKLFLNFPAKKVLSEKERNKNIKVLKPVSMSNWFSPCADESLYASTGLSKGHMGKEAWRPAHNDVVRLYKRIADSGGVIGLAAWTSPRMRPPSPNQDEEYETDEDEKDARKAASKTDAAGEEDAAETTANDFDFDAGDDLDGPVRQITPRRPGAPGAVLKGSARKKTTDFKNVIKDMQRHRQIDAMNREKAAKAAKEQQNAQ